MINTISELYSDGLWESFNAINSVKPNNPSVGDIYYDNTRKSSYLFDGKIWKELVIKAKNTEINKARMRKINNIFSENQT